MTLFCVEFCFNDDFGKNIFYNKYNEIHYKCSHFKLFSMQSDKQRFHLAGLPARSTGLWVFCNLWVPGTSFVTQLLRLENDYAFSTRLQHLNDQPMPKSPRPPAIAAADMGSIEVAKVAEEKIKAAPPVTIGKTTRVKTIIDKKSK